MKYWEPGRNPIKVQRRVLLQSFYTKPEAIRSPAMLSTTEFIFHSLATIRAMLRAIASYVDAMSFSCYGLKTDGKRRTGERRAPARQRRVQRRHHQSRGDGKPHTRLSA